MLINLSALPLRGLLLTDLLRNLTMAATAAAEVVEEELLLLLLFWPESGWPELGGLIRL